MGIPRPILRDGLLEVHLMFEMHTHASSADNYQSLGRIDSLKKMIIETEMQEATARLRKNKNWLTLKKGDREKSTDKNRPKHTEGIE